MKVIASYHIKGGVGKTATAVNIAYMAAIRGHRTLLWDLDPQGAATFYFRVKPKLDSPIKTIVRGKADPDRSVKATDYPNLDLLPAALNIRRLEKELDQVKHSKSRLERLLAAFQSHYDLVILDCPPNLTLLAENVFRAADMLLIPVIPTTLAVRTYTTLVDFFAKKKLDQTKLRPFISMAEVRKKLHRETMETLPQSHPELANTVVPYQSDVERMGVHREPVAAFAPKSPAADAYRRLWQEIATFLDCPVQRS